MILNDNDAFFEQWRYEHSLIGLLKRQFRPGTDPLGGKHVPEFVICVRSLYSHLHYMQLLEESADLGQIATMLAAQACPEHSRMALS